jgi:hypothetical protein
VVLQDIQLVYSETDAESQVCSHSTFAQAIQMLLTVILVSLVTTTGHQTHLVLLVQLGDLYVLIHLDVAHLRQTSRADVTQFQPQLFAELHVLHGIDLLVKMVKDL